MLKLSQKNLSHALGVITLFSILLLNTEALGGTITGTINLPQTTPAPLTEEEQARQAAFDPKDFNHKYYGKLAFEITAVNPIPSEPYRLGFNQPTINTKYLQWNATVDANGEVILPDGKSVRMGANLYIIGVNFYKEIDGQRSYLQPDRVLIHGGDYRIRPIDCTEKDSHRNGMFPLMDSCLNRRLRGQTEPVNIAYFHGEEKKSETIVWKGSFNGTQDPIDPRRETAFIEFTYLNMYSPAASVAANGAVSPNIYFDRDFLFGGQLLPGETRQLKIILENLDSDEIELPAMALSVTNGQEFSLSYPPKGRRTPYGLGMGGRIYFTVTLTGTNPDNRVHQSMLNVSAVPLSTLTRVNLQVPVAYRSTNQYVPEIGVWPLSLMFQNDLRGNTPNQVFRVYDVSGGMGQGLLTINGTPKFTGKGASYYEIIREAELVRNCRGSEDCLEYEIRYNAPVVAGVISDHAAILELSSNSVDNNISVSGVVEIELLGGSVGY